jgi:hypothetical protein
MRHIHLPHTLIPSPLRLRLPHQPLRPFHLRPPPRHRHIRRLPGRRLMSHMGRAQAQQVSSLKNRLSIVFLHFGSKHDD